MSILPSLGGDILQLAPLLAIRSPGNLADPTEWPSNGFESIVTIDFVEVSTIQLMKPKPVGMDGDHPEKMTLIIILIAKTEKIERLNMWNVFHDLLHHSRYSTSIVSPLFTWFQLHQLLVFQVFQPPTASTASTGHPSGHLRPAS